ncbi:Glutathione synthetase [Planctomycetes bacterium MalM25]|nr:Glutathione synthetase [Planctomycetes bacterium MalM25]
MRRRRLAVIMDPIEAIKPHKDSSLAMLLEAQRRGWEIHYGQLHDIWLREGQAFGRLTALQVADDHTEWFVAGNVAVTLLSDMDVILMRKDPPFDMQYIFATYVLQRAEDDGALVINGPQGLRDANEKAFMAWFPDCAPPTLITRSRQEMRNFVAEHQKVVVKPLDLMGGRSVFVTDAEDGNRNVVLETVSHYGSRYIMLQKYLTDIVDSGDKRIILIDGKPIPKALVRIPTPGDHRGNMDAGARTEIRPLTDRDTWICEQIGPALRDKDLIFVGIDVIGNVMTEINVTSATGIRELERATDLKITKQLFDVISSKLIGT